MSSTHKLLLDENLSWRVVRGLVQAGYEAISTRQLGLDGLKDLTVFRRAQQEQRIIITRDSDFLKNFAPPHFGIIVLDCADTVGNKEILQKLETDLPALLAHSLADTVQTITIG